MRHTGATGPTGSGGGAIIPFASGLALALTTIAGGLAGTGGLLGFGTSAPTPTILGGAIDLTGPGGVDINYAFSMPRDGTITAIASYFSTTAGLNSLVQILRSRFNYIALPLQIIFSIPSLEHLSASPLL